jgi:hypothetical protein
MANHTFRVKLLKRVVTKTLEEVHNKNNLIDQSDYEKLLKIYNHEYIQNIPNGREWAYLMGCKASILAHLAVHIIDHPKLIDMYKCLDLIKQRYLIEKHHKIRNCKMFKDCPICNTCGVEVLYKRLWNIIAGGAVKQSNINKGKPEQHVCVETELPLIKEGMPEDYGINSVKHNILGIHDDRTQYPENAINLPETVDWPVLRETLDCYVMNSKTPDSHQYLDEID